MQNEHDDPAGWFVAGLVALIAAALVGGRRPRADWQRAVLVVAALAATVLGVVAIFSVGLPILVAAGLLWAAQGPRSHSSR